MVGHRDRLADQLFDVAQERCLLGIAERDRDAVRAGARGAADAVDIGFRHVRKIEVHDVADAVDIDPAGGNVGGHERAHIPLAKRGEYTFALVLRLVAVDRLRRDAGFDETSHHLVRAMLGAGEYEGAVDLFALAGRRRGRLPCPAIHRMMRCSTRSTVARPASRHLDRIAQHLAGQFGDGVRHGRGKE
jgi:hypothetical protein